MLDKNSGLLMGKIDIFFLFTFNGDLLLFFFFTEMFIE